MERFLLKYIPIFYFDVFASLVLWKKLDNFYRITDKYWYYFVFAPIYNLGLVNLIFTNWDSLPFCICNSEFMKIWFWIEFGEYKFVSRWFNLFHYRNQFTRHDSLLLKFQSQLYLDVFRVAKRMPVGVTVIWDYQWFHMIFIVD